MTIDRSEASEVADWVIENIPDKAQFTHAQALLTLAAEVRRLRERERVLVEALRFYEDPRNWGDDDWSVQSVICQPDYGDPGKTARAALEAVKE